MGNQNSAATSTPSVEEGCSRKTPNCKICCACPQQRRARDECTLLRDVSECEKEINAFYQCLLDEGFSQQEVDGLRRNTKRM